MSIIEIITNKYVISIIGAILALLFTYMYDKFEKKEYSSVQYIKMAFVGYVVSLISVVIAKHAMNMGDNDIPLPFISKLPTTTSTTSPPAPSGSTVTAQTGGNSSVIDMPKPSHPPQFHQTSSSQPQYSTKLDNLDFRIGTPTF